MSLKCVKTRLKDLAIQKWRTDIYSDARKNKDYGNKLRTYRNHKPLYEYEQYLTQVCNIRDRIALTKLRISDHDLQIERGRYEKPYKKPVERTCPKCLLQTEDEKHFLIKCELYNDVREKLRQKSYEIKVLCLQKSSDEHLFNTIMHPPQKAQTIIAKYINDCFSLFNGNLCTK